MSKNELSLIKKDTVDVVANRVRQLQENNQIDLPPGYSAENAMKSAWLKLQETKDKSGKPALEACTKNSIANALLDMVVQGLNPSKDQCYFIPYGQQLVCQRSYFGTLAVAKRMAGIKDVHAEVIRKGDEFEYNIEKGRKKIEKHKQKFENMNAEIVGAYAIAEFEDGREDTEIMTIDDIKKAWAQGKVYKEGGNGTHQKFEAPMATKTVINRICKKHINSSSDDHLFQQAFNRADEIKTEQEVQEEIQENANQEPIDVDDYEVDQDTGEVQEEPQKEQEQPEPEQTTIDEQEQQTGTDGPGF